MIRFMDESLPTFLLGKYEELKNHIKIVLKFKIHMKQRKVTAMKR